MKKFISLSLSALALSSFLLFNVTNVTAAEQNYENNYNLNRGEESRQLIFNLINDGFSNWNSSIFSPRIGSPTMVNNTLALPRNSMVSSTPFSFTGNNRYRVVLGNLNGSINVAIRNAANGLIISEQTLTGNGTEVSFDYSHRNDWLTTGPSIIDLMGESDTSTTSYFRIDKY